MILLHGTTRWRAERILRDGPEVRFREPGGQSWEDGFSLCLEAGPFPFGSPEQYARGKANEFPDEGGPVILMVDVPEDVIALTINDWFPLSQGLIQFDRSSGLEELLSAWQNLEKRIVVLDES
jgi:hypothetical protein